MQMGKQVIGERQCCVGPPKKLQGVLERTIQPGKQITSERECWVGPPIKRIYKALWIGQCSWASKLLVKESVGQLPPQKKEF